MQKEITKRLRLYSIAAVLLAVILVSVCYQLGYIPQSPNRNTSSAMSTFSSFDELRDFLKTKSSSQWGNTYYESFNGRFLVPMSTPSVIRLNALSPQTAIFDSAAGGTQYSTTNIQVAGVDEADFVKTDGQYIYLITGNNLSIVKAYPPEDAQLVFKTSFTDIAPVGIFVNGDKLVILGAKYDPAQVIRTDYIAKLNYFSDIGTYVKVYDISNKTEPKLLRDYQTNGGYFSSRMLGDYVYFVTSQPAYSQLEILPSLTVDKVNLPKIEATGYSREAAPDEIYYANVSDNYFVFTTIYALNLMNATQPPTSQTIMLGGTSAMYVSLNNVYITFPQNENTTIYRVHIANDTIIPEAHGEVPGQILNQFSMDEYDDHFRVATTTWTNSTNNVYVLDMNMSTVGRLENLAQGEHIYSARFMGKRGYLVTFVQIDPLFVIDLSDPTNPTVLGELKIPGYSNYLHPYDENHVIGIGKETRPSEQGVFAWYQGVKISLFDVSNVTNPIQMANFTIGDRGTDSPILYDHKAFLFDKEKNLLVIPVTVAKVMETYPSPSAYGQPVWQGAYVFNITLQQGLVLKGGITHIDNSTGLSDYTRYVQRSLYIGNVLYTISQAQVKLNDLNDLAFIKAIEIG
jgi:inhibitor of cysteine peptidase